MIDMKKNNSISIYDNSCPDYDKNVVNEAREYQRNTGRRAPFCSVCDCLGNLMHDPSTGKPICKDCSKGLKREHLSNNPP